MKVQNLKDLYIHQLKDLFSAEKQIIEALPQMAEAATDAELKEAFQNHLEQSRQHKDKVQSLLEGLESNPTSTKCKAMEGLVEEGSEAIQMEGHRATRDAALIAAAQRVEHYEIASYGTVRTYAQELGYQDAANTLEEILKEESETNELLNSLATGGILSKGMVKAIGYKLSYFAGCQAVNWLQFMYEKNNPKIQKYRPAYTGYSS